MISQTKLTLNGNSAKLTKMGGVNFGPVKLYGGADIAEHPVSCLAC